MNTRKSRRQSSHKCSQVQFHFNKTFTDSHSLSLHQSTLNRNYLSNLEFDNQINHPYTFMDKAKTFDARKKFQFNQKDSIQKICNVIMDDFISKLDESSEYQDNEKQLLTKLNFIQYKHEQLKSKYKHLQEFIKFERFEKEVLERQLIELNKKLKEERMRREILHKNYTKYRMQSMKAEIKQMESSNEETMRQFLKYQIRKLKRNNKQIDEYSSENF